MGPTHGTKERIIARNKYNPRPKAFRKVRVVTPAGATQTYKRAGDRIITERSTILIEKEGFQS